MNTYINDKKLAEYPFYDTEADAPPPGCIRYLGVCLRGVTTPAPVYASAITIGMDGILVSLQIEGSTDELGIGTVYATATEGKVSMVLTGGTISGTASMLIDKTLLANSYGTYKGKFYLDPSCVTYMSDAVAGTLTSVRVNGTTYSPSQSLNFTCMGDVVELVGPEISGTTATALIRGTTSVNTYNLVNSSSSTKTYVGPVNEITGGTATAAVPYPTLTLAAENPDNHPNAIQIAVVRGSETTPADLVLDLIGTTAFPNCYEKGDEA